MFLSAKKLFVATLLPCFLMVGCQRTLPQDSPSPPPPPEKSEPLTPPSPTQKEESVWQTDDVDISRINPQKRLVALTFDDAPTGKLDALLDVFIDFNKAHPDCPASATLFCNGSQLCDRLKESLYTAYALGLELGNHSFSHLDLTAIDERKIEEEISLVDKFLEEIDGKPLHLFRAPYGKTDGRVLEKVKVPVIDWFIDTKDWQEKEENRLIEAVFSRLQDGAIILMHDGYESTVEGVRKLLPALAKAGYQAVGVSELAKAHGCTLRAGKVYTRARKQKA